MDVSRRLSILPHDTPQTRLSVPILVFYNVTGFGTPSSDRARHVQHSTCFATVPRIHFGVTLQQRRTTCRKTRAPAVYSVVRHRRSQVISRAGADTPNRANPPAHQACHRCLARTSTDGRPSATLLPSVKINRPRRAPPTYDGAPAAGPTPTAARYCRSRVAPPARHDARRCQYAARARAGRVRT